MIDPEDRKTQALPLEIVENKRNEEVVTGLPGEEIPPAEFAECPTRRRPRGRPATGNAMSNAERQRRYRENLKAQRNEKIHQGVAEDLRAELANAIERAEKAEEKARAEYALGEKARQRVKELEAELAQRNGKEIFEKHKQDMRAAGNTPITPYRLGLQVGKTGIGLDLNPPYETAKSKESYKNGIKIGRQSKAAK